MTKNISTSLVTSLSNNVVFTALLLEIVRPDGAVFRITNHDQDIAFGGDTYVSSVPFTIGAITHGTQLSVDNCEVTLSTNGSVFDKSEWQAGLFQRAKVRVRIVDAQDLTNGDVIMHEGWIGVIDTNQLEYVQFTIYGLLKILDFKIGRVYQPSCDADFGDRRCKVAVDPSQAYSEYNRYHVGEWVYYYDKSTMTTLSPVNPSFETDGARNSTEAITGWTRSEINDMTVTALKGTLAPTQGSYLLAGGTGTGTGTGRLEQTLFQTISLTGAGISALDLDAGKISVYYAGILAQTPNRGDAVEISLEVLNANGDVIDRHETRYSDFDLASTWRQRTIVTPLIAGARSIRIALGMYRTNGMETAAAVDLVELYYWDHTTTDPNDGVIHKAVRVYPSPAVDYVFPINHSFEADGALINSNTTDITGWTRDSGADFFAVATTSGATAAPFGDYCLIGGNDASGLQKTYTIYQDVSLASKFALDTTLIDLGRYAFRVQWTGVFGDTDTDLKVEVRWYNAGAALISGETLQAFDNAGVGVKFYEVFTTPPANARTMRILISIRTPVGSSNGTNAGIDRIRVVAIDAERPAENDPIYGEAGSGTVFSTNAAELTDDGGVLLWKSRALVRNFDTVDTVSSNKVFTGTNISGEEERYIGARIRWLSGANAGQRNLIRIYDEPTKGISLYFDSLSDIQAGDRFVYEFACQKRFVEDCVTLYGNGINFRGFPYLPGKFNA